MSTMFRSLRVPNYRLWFAGALISNTGAWMQRTAQDWIVLTELTDHDATALGITTALQFGPLLLLMPISGVMADRLDRRTVLIWTQLAQCVLALGLGILVITGSAQLGYVYAFSLALGIVTAIDNPARQSFVSDLVGAKDLPNAVALNAMTFQGARLVGPALAGVLVAVLGAGPVFLINTASFAGVLLALGLIRRSGLQKGTRGPRRPGMTMEGLRYVRSRPDIIVVLVAVLLFGAFGFNYPIYISTMSTIEFGQDAAVFGVLASSMAVGAIVGALLAARRERVPFGVIVVASAAFGVASLLAAVAPDIWFFGAALVLVGVCSLTTINSANAYLQTTIDPSMRGRVMAIYLAVFAAGTPIGAPIVGWVATHFGPRWSIAIAAAAAVVAALVALVWLVRARNLRLRWVPGARGRIRVRYDGAEGRELAAQEIALAEEVVERAG